MKYTKYGCVEASSALQSALYRMAVQYHLILSNEKKRKIISLELLKQQ